MELGRAVAHYVRNRRFEHRYKCHLHPGAMIQPENRGLPDSIVVGANTDLRGQLFTFGHGGRIRLGEYCYLGENSRIWSASEIRIGDRVLIGHNSSIFDSDTHPLSARQRHEQYVSIITSGHPEVVNLREEPVTIEDNAWIGLNVVMLKGVHVGEGAVVAAGSVVTKDVPPYCVVAGNPARVVRELGPDER